MSWSEALRAYTAVDAAKIQTSALELEIHTGSGRYIVHNLKLEHFLPETIMCEIQKFLLLSSWSDPAKTVEDYQTLCITHVLQGGPIRTPNPPKYLGRAVEEKALINGVFRGNKRKISRKHIAALIERFVNKSASRIDVSTLRRLPMSQYASWVTWDSDSGGDEDPFGFSRPCCADEIRASLGLSMYGLGQPIILLTYLSVAAPPIHRPTCADAGLFLRFEPPPVGFEAHGLTKPWEEIPRAKKPTCDPKPEGLHEQMLFPSDFEIVRRGSRIGFTA